LQVRTPFWVRPHELASYRRFGMLDHRTQRAIRRRWRYVSRSGQGQKHRLDSRQAASGLARSTDDVGAVRHFAFGPQADSCTQRAASLFRISRRRWHLLEAAVGYRVRPRLLLARIVCWVDVIDAPWPDELNLENPLLISGPGVVRVLCGIHPQRARL